MTTEALDTLSCEYCGKEWTGRARFAQRGRHVKDHHGAVTSGVDPIWVHQDDLPKPHNTPITSTFKDPRVWFALVILLPMGILGVIAGSGFTTNATAFLIAFATPVFMVWTSHIRHYKEFVYYEVDPDSGVKSRVIHYVHRDKIRELITKYPELREARWTGAGESYEFVLTPNETESVGEGEEKIERPKIAVFQPLNVTRPYAQPRMLFSITVQDDLEMGKKTPDPAAERRKNIGLGALAVAYGGAFFLVQELINRAGGA